VFHGDAEIIRHRHYPEIGYTLVVRFGTGSVGTITVDDDRPKRHGDSRPGNRFVIGTIEDGDFQVLQFPLHHGQRLLLRRRTDLPEQKKSKTACYIYE
jgi:hypothetical protein